MNTTAVVETLRRAARLSRAMNDPALAIDLYDLTARVAVRSAIATVAEGDPRRRDLEAILAPDRRFPTLTLSLTRGYPQLTLAGTGRLAAVGKLIDRAFDDGVITSWPMAREACAAMRTCAAACLPCTITDGSDPRPLWRLALSAFEELLSVTPVPLLLEPAAPAGQHAHDKVLYRAPGVAAGLQDAGFAYDHMIIDRDRLAIARVALPPAQQAPFLRRHADHHFRRGGIDAAERLIREALAIHPNAEDHDALVRYLLASPTSDETRFHSETRRWAELYAGEERLASVAYGNDRDADRPLRVGYLCSFIDSPLARHTLVPMFEAHDRNAVQVYFYNQRQDSATARCACDAYRDIGTLDTDQTFRLLQNDGIDLLVDLDGRVRPGNRYDVLCRKPAPIQINWFNLAATTGLRAFDYVIAEPSAVPRNKQAIYSEEITHLPCQVAASWRLPAEPRAARPPSQSKGVFVFASFAAAFRHNAPVLDLWGRLLRDIPDTILYLKNSALYTPAYKSQVRDHFVTRGIAPDRLRLESASDFPEMLALYADVDLGLDTFPCSSGTTTTEALWQGVPTLTLLTEDWRGRTSAAILTEAGLSDFVARTPDEYVEKARHFARHPERLAAIRTTIRNQLVAGGSARFDVTRFTRDLEAAYRSMWRRWLSKGASRAARAGAAAEAAAERR